MPTPTPPLPDMDQNEKSDPAVQLALKLIAAFPERFSADEQNRLFAERDARKEVLRGAGKDWPRIQAASAALAATNDEIVLRSQKLVFDLAKKARAASRADPLRPDAGLSLADLLQEGNQALAKAIEDYRPGSGTQFTTFAGTCIRNHLSDAVQRWKVFPQPRQTGGSSRGKNAKPPDGPDKLPPVSLEALADPKTGANEADRLPDPNSGAGLAQFERADFSQDLKNRIGKILQTLTDREREVLLFRYGLADGFSRTLLEVGKSFNVTMDRIRMIEAKALRKLRRSDP